MHFFNPLVAKMSDENRHNIIQLAFNLSKLLLGIFYGNAISYPTISKIIIYLSHCVVTVGKIFLL